MNVNFSLLNGYEKPYTFQCSFSTLTDRGSREARKALTTFEKVWGYAGKSLVTVRHVANSVLQSCRWIALSCQTRQSLRDVVLHLKLFSIASVTLNLLSVPTMVKKVWNQIQWKDGKGIALATLSVSVLLADTFDSLTTFINAVLQLAVKPATSWMAALGFPLAVAIIGMGSMIRLVRIKDISQLLHEVDGKVLAVLSEKRLNNDELRVHLKKFVDEKVSAPIEDKRYKVAVLEQHGNAKTVKLMHEIAEIIGEDPLTHEKIAQIKTILESIVDSLQKERKVQCGYLLANFISAAAMGAFSIPGAPALPFILLAISTLTRLSTQAFQDHF